MNNQNISDIQISKLDIINEAMGSTPGVLCTIKGCFAKAEVVNNNGRYYPSKFLQEKVLKDATMNDLMKCRCLYGEATHPTDRFDTELTKVSHSIRSLEWDEKNKQIIGTADILDTPAGRIINTMVRYGANMGVSIRARGSLKQDKQGHQVPDEATYVPKTFDLVPNPGFSEARLSLVNESTGESISLLESIKSLLQSYSEAELLSIQNIFEQSSEDESLGTVSNQNGNYGSVNSLRDAIIARIPGHSLGMGEPLNHPRSTNVYDSLQGTENVDSQSCQKTANSDRMSFLEGLLAQNPNIGDDMLKTGYPEVDSSHRQGKRFVSTSNVNRKQVDMNGKTVTEGLRFYREPKTISKNPEFFGEGTCSTAKRNTVCSDSHLALPTGRDLRVGISGGNASMEDPEMMAESLFDENIDLAYENSLLESRVEHLTSELCKLRTQNSELLQQRFRPSQSSNSGDSSILVNIEESFKQHNSSDLQSLNEKANEYREDVLTLRNKLAVVTEQLSQCKSQLLEARSELKAARQSSRKAISRASSYPSKRSNRKGNYGESNTSSRKKDVVSLLFESTHNTHKRGIGDELSLSRNANESFVNEKSEEINEGAQGLINSEVSLQSLVDFCGKGIDAESNLGGSVIDEDYQDKELPSRKSRMLGESIDFDYKQAKAPVVESGLQAFIKACKK